MFIKFLSLILFVLAVTMTVPDGFEKGGEVNVTVVSATQASQLFAEFKSHKEIPFGYPIDGCYARATAMARIAEQEKIEMGKIWAHGMLIVKSKDPIFPEIEWGYHVAPVLYVKDKDNAKLMVFDPSLFDKPVTVEEWTSKMKGAKNARVDKVYYGSRFQFGPRPFEEKKYSWHREDLKETTQVMEDYSRTLKALRLMNGDSDEKFSPEQILNGGVR